MSLSKHGYSWNIKLLLEPVSRIAKTSFLHVKFTRQVFCSFLNAPMCEHRSYCGFLYITCVHATCHLSEWQKRSALRSVNITSQIWPIRGYTSSWYTGTSRLKKWLQAVPPFLSPASSHFIFMFAFSRPADSTTSEPGTGYSSADQCLTNWANQVAFSSITRRTSWKQTPLES